MSARLTRSLFLENILLEERAIIKQKKKKKSDNDQNGIKKMRQYKAREQVVVGQVQY